MPIHRPTPATGTRAFSATAHVNVALGLALSSWLGAACTSPSAAPSQVAVSEDEAVLEASAPGEGFGLLVEVRAERGARTDRLVFEFDNAVPGYRLHYVDPVGLRDSAGTALPLPGDSALVVELGPSPGNDTPDPPATVRYQGPQRLTLEPPDNGAGIVEELIRTDGAGADLTWAVGVRERVRFTVRTGSAPPTLVIELDHDD